jgi:hypothetical protein
MKHYKSIALFAAFIVLASVVFFSVPRARAEVSAKMNFPSGAVVYYGMGTTTTGHVADTVAFTSDRNFLDTAAYDIAVFVSNLDGAGYWKASLLNDSSVLVTSSAAGDSLKSYYYLIFYRPK